VPVERRISMTDRIKNDNIGISASQIENHIKQQYNHQLAKKREIEARLIRAEISWVDDTYCQLRSLKKEFVYSSNSVRLHEYYFQNTGAGPVERPSLVTVVLSRDFGSYEEWEEQFKALALCARGWVLAGYDLKEGRINNYITDSNSEGVWSVLPLLVLDVYEHAYCQQFQSRRDYVNAFIQNIDWALVDRRTSAAIELYRTSRDIF
jgi:Fe-Mn family superoxide dismutase